MQQFLVRQEPQWNTRRRRWEVQLEGELYHYDQTAALRAATFIETFCRITEGREFILQPGQRDIVHCLFGWKRRNGLRRFRELFLFVASGYGKSMLFSAIMLYLLYCLAPPGAEMYNIAADVEQARPVFQSSVAMVDSCPALASRAEIFGRNPNSLRRAIVHRNGAFYQVLSSTVHAKHGKRIFAVAIDEEHVLPGDGREIVATLSTMAKKYRESLILKASTAGFNQDHVCFEDYQHAIAVRDGVQINHGFLPVLFYADAADDWTQPATWRKANPNLGISIAEEEVAAECRQAQDIPSRRNQFLRLRCNLWTDQETIWIPVEQWDACEPEPFNPAALRAFEQSLVGQRCFGGLDLSTNLDLTALALLFPPSSTTDTSSSAALPRETTRPSADTGEVAAPPVPAPFRALFRFWVPRDNVKHLVAKLHLNNELLRWTEPCHCHAGGDHITCSALVHTTSGNVIDHDLVRAHINVLAALYPIEQLAVDKFGATQIITQLIGDLGEDRVLAVSQTTAFFTPPMREMERWILSRSIRHAAHPVARWNIRCLAAKQEANGGIRPVKVDRQKSSKRIDGIVALLNATSRAALRVDNFNAVKGAVIL